MKIDYRWTDGNDEDFRKFYLKTEEFYSSIVGGLKNREAFVPYNLSESISDVLIASVDGVAVGCAGLKAYSDSDVEIKRVWVDPEFRGNHISSAMMDALEQRAAELGFGRAILQTRPQMEAAVHLYTKRGYELIDNYPPYDKLEGAICFAKRL
ncbi:MAG: GNAT family N-acetyltransferase [Saccharofermentans sp.]|jgi:ribosomal protein S18 acetylase RimI-like enzyme|nr:GNAT family N-acetyltransferase [Saccharofermentans sp.]